MKFAKLFDLENGEQLLAYLSFDPEEDITNIINITNMDGICVQMKLSFSGENQEEKSRKAFEHLDIKGAQRYYEAMAKAVINTPKSE